MSPQLINLFLLTALSLFAATAEAQRRSLPGWVAIVVAGAGLAIRIRVDGVSGLLFAVEGLGVSLVFFALFQTLLAGAVRHLALKAAIGILAGPLAGSSILLLSGLCTGSFALATALSQRSLRRSNLTRALVLRHVFHFLPPYRSLTASDTFTPDVRTKGELLAIALSSATILAASI